MGKIYCVVCGMEINEKNYQFNKEAFVQANSMDNLIFCPFCGVSTEYLIQEGKELNRYIDDLDNSVLKIIDHAVKLEIFNGDYYKKASLLAKDEKIKRMFDALSRIEYMHARVHSKIGRFTEVPVLKDMDYSKYSTDEMLLEMACKREKHAVEYYGKYERDITDKTVRNIFKALSLVEKEHIELTNIKQSQNLT